MVDNTLVALQASLGSRELGRVWSVDQEVSLHFLTPCPAVYTGCWGGILKTAAEYYASRTTLEAASFIKAELKRSGVSYGEFAKRLEAQSLRETEASITNKLARATVPATLLLATLAALGMDGMKLDDL
jgi:hypothetical protein